MSKEIILLLILNASSAIGYSLIAPLFPSEALKRGLKEDSSGVVIAMFAISNFLATPFCPSLISKYGRKNILYVASILEGSSTLVYGLLQYVSGTYSFFSIAIITRIFHGIGCSFSSTLVYSIAASICEPENIEITLGQMELCWCIGVAIGPVCASVFFYLGGYSLPFYVCGLAILSCIPFVYNLQLQEEEEGDSPQFIRALFDFTVLTIFFTVVVDIFSRSFYFPTLSDHLISRFGLSIEGSAIFFVVNLLSYFLVLNYLNLITKKLGIKLTLCCGMVCLFVGVLFLPPIPFLPQSISTVIIGLLIIGVPDAIINVPAICDLIETFKKDKRFNLDDNAANDMASAIYNLALNFGEAIGPIFGGFVTEKSNFQRSCVYTSIIDFSYCLFFFFINYNFIKSHFKKEPQGVLLEGETRAPSIKQMLSDDGSYNEDKASRVSSVRKFVPRHRSYNISRRSSAKSSLNFSNSIDHPRVFFNL